MRKGLPSVTAMFVAFARAVATHEDELSRACHDDTAETLVPRPFRTLVNAAARAPEPARAFSFLRSISFGLVDHLAFRAAVIDRAVGQAVARGARQLVLLGAGLDSRAHRMPELESCVVFEVDHPSTQALKQRKVRGLGVRAGEVRYAACDFERVSLEEALSSVRFDPTIPSAWIWEGVTMYLEPQAVAGTLDTVARLSAPHSTLVASYLTPDVVNAGPVLGRFGLETLRYLSEPVRFITTPSEMERRLEAHDFAVIEDVLPRDVASEYGAHVSRLALVMPSERLVIASKGMHSDASRAEPGDLS